jgi:hypothetical protein
MCPYIYIYSEPLLIRLQLIRLSDDPVRNMKNEKILKNVVFWDVALCRSCINRRFGGTYRLHLQGRRIRERGSSVSKWLHTEKLLFTVEYIL